MFLADDLGSTQNGPERRSAGAVTPAIDSIARNGITFTAGYAKPPVLERAPRLLAGRWPARSSVGVVNGPGPQMLPGVDTLAERLRRLGYDTRAFGKLHEGSPSAATRSTRASAPSSAGRAAPRTTPDTTAMRRSTGSGPCPATLARS